MLVMNPNYNTDPQTEQIIPENSSMEDHACYIWEHFVKDSHFKTLYVLAHSAGGGCVSAIMKKYPESFFSKVKQIAYTDSWVIPTQELPKELHSFMTKRAVHYLASGLPLGTEESGQSILCPHVSAGHQKHEYTTGKAWPMIMLQFDRHVTS